MKRISSRMFTLQLCKELVLSFLAVASVASVAFEYFGRPSASTVSVIDRFDVVVAVLFLADFGFSLAVADDKRRFLKRNWYLLLASIPIISSWAELLRGLRLLELLRLIRAGSHISYTIKSSRKKAS